MNVELDLVLLDFWVCLTDALDDSLLQRLQPWDIFFLEVPQGGDVAPLHQGHGVHACHRLAVPLPAPLSAQRTPKIARQTTKHSQVRQQYETILLIRILYNNPITLRLVL